jgi:hypothetical protein
VKAGEEGACAADEVGACAADEVARSGSVGIEDELDAADDIDVTGMVRTRVWVWGE